MRNVFLSANYEFLSVDKNNTDFMGVLENLTMTSCQLKCIFVRELCIFVRKKIAKRR